MAQVRQECHELLRYAREAITDLTGLEPLCPASPEWYMQMATIILRNMLPLLTVNLFWSSLSGLMPLRALQADQK